MTRANPLPISEVKNYLRDPYAWPGGYRLTAYCADGEPLCRSCILASFRDVIRAHGPDGWDRSWVIIAIGVHWEGPCETCAQCGADLPSEYGDPEEPDEPQPSDPTIVYPWRHEDFDSTRHEKAGGWVGDVILPAFRVVRSPGGRRAYAIGDSDQSQHVKAIDKLLRKHPSMTPIEAATRVAADCGRKLDSMRTEYTARPY